MRKELKDIVSIQVSEAQSAQAQEVKATLTKELMVIVDSRVSEANKELQEVTPNTKLVEAMIKKAVTTQNEEMDEIERRKNNVVIYRVEESPADDAVTRLEADKSFFKELHEGPLDLLQDKDVKIIRLGKRVTGGTATSPRPVLLKFSEEEAKKKFMLSLKNLKTAADRFRKISVAHDLTANQRAAVRKALSDARHEHETQDPSQQGNWVFRVTNHQKNPKVSKYKVG